MSATPAHQSTGKRESCAGHSTLYRHDSTLEGYDNPIRQTRNKSIRHFYKYDSFNDGIDNPLVGDKDKVDGDNHSDVTGIKISLPANINSSMKSPKPERGKVSAIRAMFEDRVAKISKKNNDDIKKMNRRSVSSVGGFERYSAKVEASPALKPEDIPYSRKDRVLVSPLVTQPVSSIKDIPQASSQGSDMVNVNENVHEVVDKIDKVEIENNAPLHQCILELRDGRTLHLTETESGVIEVISTADDSGVVPERISLFGSHRVPRQISLHEDDRMSMSYNDQSPTKAVALQSESPNKSTIYEHNESETEERNTIDEYFDKNVSMSQHAAANSSGESQSASRPVRKSMTKATSDAFQSADVSMVDKLVIASGSDLVSVDDKSTSGRQKSVSGETVKEIRTSSLHVPDTTTVRNSDVNAFDANMVGKLIAAAGRDVISASDSRNSSASHSRISDAAMKTPLSVLDENNSDSCKQMDTVMVDTVVHHAEAAATQSLSNMKDTRDSSQKTDSLLTETAATTTCANTENKNKEAKISATVAKERQRCDSILKTNVLTEETLKESSDIISSNTSTEDNSPEQSNKEMSEELHAAVARITSERYGNSALFADSSEKTQTRKMSLTGKLGEITVEENEAVKRIVSERYCRESVQKAIIDSSIIAPKSSSQELRFSDVNEKSNSNELEDISNAIMRKSVEDDAVARIFVEQCGPGAAKRVVAESGIAERLSGGMDEGNITVSCVDREIKDMHSDEKATLIALKQAVSKKKSILDSLKGRGSDDSNEVSDEEAFKRRSRDAEKALLELKERLVQEKTAEVLKAMEKEEAILRASKQKADEEDMALQALQKAVSDEAKRKLAAKEMYMSDKQREEESAAAIFALAVAMEEQKATAARKKAEEEQALAATAKKKAEEEEAALIALMIAVQEETSLAERKAAEEEAVKKKAEEGNRLEVMQKKAEEYKLTLKAKEAKIAEAAKVKAEEDRLALKAEEANRLEAMQKKAGDYKLALKAEEARRVETAKRKVEEDKLALKAAKDAKRAEAVKKKARQNELALKAEEEARKEEALKKKADEVLLASKEAEELRKSESMYRKAKEDELAENIAVTEKARRESEPEEIEDEGVIFIVPFSNSSGLEDFQIKKTDLPRKKSTPEKVEVTVQESKPPPKKKIPVNIPTDRTSLSVKEMYLQAMRSVNYSSTTGRASDERGLSLGNKEEAVVLPTSSMQMKASDDKILDCDVIEECNTVNEESTPNIIFESQEGTIETESSSDLSSSKQEKTSSNDGNSIEEKMDDVHVDVPSEHEIQTLSHDEVSITAVDSISELNTSSETTVDNVELNQNGDTTSQNDSTLTKFENDTKTNFGDEEEFLRPLSIKFSSVLSEMSVAGSDGLKKAAVEESKKPERDSSISSITSFRYSSEASVNSHQSLFANVLKDIHLSIGSQQSSAPNSRVSSLQRSDSLNFLKDSTFGNDSRLLKSIMHSRYMTDMENNNATESTWTSSDDDSD